MEKYFNIRYEFDKAVVQERIAQKYQATLDEIAVIKQSLEKAVNKLHHIFDEESE